jgi:hypothetical protein
MITLLLSTYLLMTVGGVAVILQALLKNEIGFEDELGYHSLGEADLIAEFAMVPVGVPSGHR